MICYTDYAVYMLCSHPSEHILRQFRWIVSTSLVCQGLALLRHPCSLPIPCMHSSFSTFAVSLPSWTFAGWDSDNSGVSGWFYGHSLIWSINRGVLHGIQIWNWLLTFWYIFCHPCWQGSANEMPMRSLCRSGVLRNFSLSQTQFPSWQSAVGLLGFNQAPSFLLWTANPMAAGFLRFLHDSEMKFGWSVCEGLVEGTWVRWLLHVIPTFICNPFCGMSYCNHN